MNLYAKILGFIKPFWKLIVASTLLTFFYVLFNSVSLWVTVDLVKELFTPEPAVTAKVTEPPADPDAGSGDRLNMIRQKADLYNRLNRAVKSVIIQENRDSTLKIVCLLIFLSFFLKNVVFYFRRVLISIIELNVTINIRNKIMESLIYQPIAFFEKRHSGQLASVVFNDVKSVNLVLKDSFGKMLMTPMQILTNMVLMFIFSWQLTLFTFIIVPVSGSFIYKIGQSIRRKSRRVFQQISFVMATFHETISALRIVKAFTGESSEKEKFIRENKKFYHFNLRANKLNFLTSPFNETMGAFMGVVLLWYGGHMIYADSGLDAEKFMRFLVFLFASFSPMKELANIHNEIQTGMAAAERIFDIIESPAEIYETPDSVSFDGFRDRIEYNHITFQYTQENPDILKDVSLEIKKGETVALVGPSGSGKTTLVNLLPRFYEIQDGCIRIDGTDTKKYSLISLRRQIGIVTQDPILFNDTIRANIAYGNRQATEHEIIEAARVANAMEFISRMDQGLDSVIGERGVTLSGGQKQRLSIARAILKNPPILILDEATSALDTESERLVQDAIDKLMKNRTVLAIAHRLSTVINSDKIVVMQNGRIVGLGPHTTLIKTCPLYKMLYEMQFMDGSGKEES
ncbi:ABC transporter ATP-binding protein [bacterium]|nr:ABC transporter ATP-binding protein [bacterium]